MRPSTTTAVLSFWSHTIPPLLDICDNAGAPDTTRIIGCQVIGKYSLTCSSASLSLCPSHSKPSSVYGQRRWRFTMRRTTKPRWRCFRCVCHSLCRCVSPRWQRLPKSSIILTNMGLVHAALGEHEAAVERFIQATARDPYLAVACVIHYLSSPYPPLTSASTHQILPMRRVQLPPRALRLCVPRFPRGAEPSAR